MIFNIAGWIPRNTRKIRTGPAIALAVAVGWLAL
jgi:hypothetical protein